MTGGALGGLRGESYLSSQDAVQECAWEDSAGALCS